MNLENILKERAKIFDRSLNGALTYYEHNEPKIIYDAIRWIPLSGGKRLRPIITMLTCEAVGGRPESTIPLGIALEYIHNATLIHDDIIDGDKWRRGLQTTHRKFGLSIAIVAGDALIGETYRMFSYMAPPELKSNTFKMIIRLIADAAKLSYEGQALDLVFDKRFDITIQEAKRHNLQVIAGCGSNDTRKAIDLCKEASVRGADAALVITPYYNKPNQEGLYQHFMSVADESDIPVMLYNVPSRTNVNLLPENVERLSYHENIVALKTA